MRALFLYTNGRESRLDPLSAGDAPSEKFYGLPELRQMGIEADFLEEADLGLMRWEGEKSSSLISVFDRIVKRVTHFSPRRIAGLLKARRKLSAYNYIITTNNALSMDASLLKAMGVLRPQVLPLLMGLLPNEPGVTGWLRGLTLRATATAAISKGEQQVLKDQLGFKGRYPVHYVTFGVDCNFWRPADSETRHEPYVLSIGNSKRDYATLLSAWREDFPRLKIVTSMRVGKCPSNVEIIAGSWQQDIMTDAEVRAIVQGALFVVTPLHETSQPSGQGAILQAMACGKAVILSNIIGLWDADVMRSGETCLLVKPGDAAALSEAVRELVTDLEFRDRLAEGALNAVRDHFTVQHMAKSLLELMRAGV